MSNQKLLNSAIFLTLLITLTSCYTQFGLTKAESTEDVYGYEDEQAYEEFYENDIEVYHHVYIPRYYYGPDHFYFDPYDEWFFEPGIHFSFGYYYGPVFYAPVYYSPPYYVSPGYYCVPPIYYPPYWHPVHYPMHHPIPYYGAGGYGGPRYGYSETPMKRRDFSRRSDIAIASKTNLNRRGDGSSGNQQIVRRTDSAGDGNSGRSYNRRISSSKRRNNTPDPGSKTYKREEIKRRSTSSNSGDEPKPMIRKITNDSRRSYSDKRSNGGNTGSGYRISPPKTRKPSTQVNRSSSESRVSRSNSGSRESSITNSTFSGNRNSSSTPTVTRSSSISRSSSPARSTSSGSSRSSGSSKSSSGSSKSRRR